MPEERAPELGPQHILTASRPQKRSFSIAGHRTSISLEEAFWSMLRRAAAQDGISLSQLVARIDRGRGTAGLSSAVRVWVLDYALRNASSRPGAAVATPAGSHPASAGGPPASARD